MAQLCSRYINTLSKLKCLRFARNHAAFISTSKNNKENNLVYPESLFPKKLPSPPKTVEDFAETKNPKNWMSYGYDYENYEEDRHQHNGVSFLVITVFICGSTFILAYLPDIRDKEWSVTEAYLELHRREKNGLPLIDKNLIDPAKIELPSDEELGDTDIII